jgi:hypothetical protein
VAETKPHLGATMRTNMAARATKLPGAGMKKGPGVAARPSIFCALSP